MVINLRINSFSYKIDSNNPETIARWLGEYFVRPWRVSDLIQVFVQPSFHDDNNLGKPDWITDTKWFYDLNSGRDIDTPRKFVDALSQVLDLYDKRNDKVLSVGLVYLGGMVLALGIPGHRNKQ